MQMKTIQQNYRSELERLLENANGKSVHQKCIEFLLSQVYKYSNGLSPDIMNTIFKLRQNTYNLRNFHAFESQNPKTKNFGLDSIAYRSSQLWENISEEIRNSASLSTFKESLKKVPLISSLYHCLISFLCLLHTSRGLHSICLSLAEYILMPHLQRILKYT